MDIIKSYNINFFKLEFKLTFNTWLTLVTSDSGIGKTVLFKAMRAREAVMSNSIARFIDYTDKINETVGDILIKSRGNLIVIDNADIVLSSKDKALVSFDNHNQYIIFSHTVEGYALGPKSIAILKAEGNRRWLEYPFMKQGS